MTLNASPAKSYNFFGSISRMVLENYLSRSLTMTRLCIAKGPVEDNLRMISAIRPKFIGRALALWGSENMLEAALFSGRIIAERVHSIDPEIILQAGIFESVSRDVERQAIPERVFHEFGLAPEKRTFTYDKMIFQDGSYVGLWHANSSVPDITSVETQMWFFHLASSYIDAGCEAIHFGQVQIIGKNDPDLKVWNSVLMRIRKYASRHARRGMVICDAHVSSGVGCYGLKQPGPKEPMGFAINGKLLFDVHALPCRIKEVEGKPFEAILEKGHLDSIYGRSMGGVTPSGWECDSLPYIVDVDHWGNSGHPGKSVYGKIDPIQGIDSRYWVWGWDEVSWFVNLTREKRNEWLSYAWNWIKSTDASGFLEMPGQQWCTSQKMLYNANNPSNVFPDGYGQEDTIREIWDSQE
jgi:hypothetical protein